MYKVHVIGERPDFRVFLDLLYGRIQNVDTEGNSNPVNSRNWTDLYIKDREGSDPSVEIIVSLENSNLFEIDSKASKLEEIVSIYLFEYCGCIIFRENRMLNAQEIENLKIKYSAALNRARFSTWHNSTHDNPYPNQAYSM
jgi:hypothetical protein